MKTHRLLLSLALLSVLLSLSFGQRGGFGRPGGASAVQNPSSLLRRDDVKAELNLTDEQKAKITEIQGGIREKMQAIFQSGSDRATQQVEMRKVMAEVSAQVNAVLTADQRKRLKEIAYQIADNAAAADPDTAKAIGLTADQTAKIADLLKKVGEANASLFEKARSGELDRSEIRPRLQKNQLALNAEIGKILTDGQRAQLKQMGGHEFKQSEQAASG